MNESTPTVTSNPSVIALNAEVAARFAAVVEALPGALLCVNREWFITYANDEAMRLSRLDADLFPTAPFWDLFPEVCGTSMETHYRAAMESCERDHFEYFYPPFDVWVDVHVLPTDEGLALFYRDITEHKQAEAREAAVTRQIRQAFEAIPDGVVIVDKEWRFAFANQRALDLVGNADIVGHNIFELFPGNNEEPFGSAYRRTMAERVPTEFEAFHPEPLNTWFKVQAKPYDGRDHHLFLGYLRAQAQSELREQETARRLEQMLEATSDAVVALDPQLAVQLPEQQRTPADRSGEQADRSQHLGRVSNSRGWHRLEDVSPQHG